MAKCMTVQMKHYTSNPFQPISVIGLSKIFKLACDTDGVHENAAMWLFYFFMNKTASAALDARLTTKRADKKHCRAAGGKARYFNTYPQAVNFLLRKYATNEAIAGIESKITRFVQPSGMSLSQCAKELVPNTLRCDDVYDEHGCSKIFIKSLDALIRYSRRKC